MTGFFESLSHSLSNIDFSLFLNWEYLTDSNPESFAFSGWFTLLVVLNLLTMGALYVLLRKKAITVIGKRKIILRKVIKYNVIFSFVWLMFIIFRHQGIEYLSMRIWHLSFLIIFFIGNCVAVIVFLKAEKIKTEKLIKTDGVNYYQDYLPKKSKKRKR